jgi:hypothetical protein
MEVSVTERSAPSLPLDADDVQIVENVLDDVRTPLTTRRWLLQRAAVGAAAFSALPGVASIAAAAGGSGATAADVKKTLDVAATAEALAVTYLTAVIGMAKGTDVEKFLPVLKAANAAELDHYKVLTGAGAKPLTLKFWAPSDFFGTGLANVFPTIETAETLFVNAYLIGITTFAKAGKSDLARYGGEILGTEAEHRALARYAQGKLPNNVGFEPYTYKSLDAIVGALQKAGVGFGKKGSKPGAFATFKNPPASALTELQNNTPR